MKNADCRQDASTVFEHNQELETKWIHIIQCNDCNKTMQLKRFNEHYINNGKAIEYDTKMEYNVATQSDGWKSYSYLQTRISKAGENITTTKAQTNNIFTMRSRKSINNDNNSNDNNQLHLDDIKDEEERVVVDDTQTTTNNSKPSSNTNVYHNFKRHPNI